MRNAAIFVSYRRDDTGPFALALRSELDLRLQGAPAFVDLVRIQGGDAWGEVLQDALSKSRLVIALIGDNWVGRTEGAAHRIADPGDWVAREVALGLASNNLLPVLVNNASLPSEADLPDALKAILGVQTVPLRAQSWEADLRMLCDAIRSRFGVTLKTTKQMMPPQNPIKLKIEPIPDEDLQRLRDQGNLPGWNVDVIHDVTLTGAVREFLHKKFLFQRDKDAFAFMGKIGDVTKKMDHHPIIEAKYADVTLRLSTWDAGHRITKFDAKMAQELDKLAKRWPQRSPDG